MRCKAVVQIILSTILGVLTACASATHSTIPVLPVATPLSAAVPSVDGFPVEIHEFALPDSQTGPGNPVVGSDGAIWFSAGTLQMDRVIGSGSIAVFNGPPISGMTGFFDSIVHAGRLFTIFYAEGGVWGTFPSIHFARVSMSGAITPDATIAGDNVQSVFFATDASGGLWEYQRLYGGGGYLLGPGQFCGPFSGDADSLAYGADGNLFVAALEVGGVPKIMKISPRCQLLATYKQPANFLVDYTSMASGSDGALWFVEAGRDVIGRITTSGTYSEYRVPFSGSRPNVLTEGSDGAIWFTDAGTNAIGRITVTDAISEFTVPTPNAFSSYRNGIVSCPRKCDGAHGRVWFSEAAAHKIGRLEF